MFSEEDRNRLSAEERFRYEVRTSLEKRGRWDFWNSPIVLWLLTTVVFGSGTFFFEWWRDWRRSVHDELQLARKIDIEIRTRVENGLAVLHRLRPGGPEAEFADFMNAIDARNSSESPSAYPEYRGRSLRSLVAERTSLVHAKKLSSKESFDALDDVIATMSGRQVRAARKMSQGEAEDQVDEVDDAIDSFIQGFREWAPATTTHFRRPPPLP